MTPFPDVPSVYEVAPEDSSSGWPALNNLSERLLEETAQRKKEIKALKEQWRSRCGNFQDSGYISRIAEGDGAAYLFEDQNHLPKFVVKPIDEEIFCLNNEKGLASPFRSPTFRARPDIPLYRSTFADVAAYELAKIAGLASYTPKTTIGILTRQEFHDFSDDLSNEDKEHYLRLTGAADKEKLCSIQDYLTNVRKLSDVLEELSSLSKEEIAACIDQSDYELCSIFVWLLFDNDAKILNFYAYTRGRNEQGQPIYGLKKIDNSLSFPEKNSGLFNSLMLLPNREKPLSQKAKKLINAIAPEKISALLKTLELTSSVTPFCERLSLLRSLATTDMSIAEINTRLRSLQLPNGKTLALTLPLTDLEIQLASVDPSDSFP